MNTQDLNALQNEREKLRDLADDFTLDIDATRQHKQRFDPRRMMVATFLFLITLGTILLSTPWAQTSGTWAWFNTTSIFSWSAFFHALLNNLFMATSTSCVTGLGVVDITTYYTTFGHVVLLCCIQLGGISLLTLGTLLVTILLGRVPAGGEEQAMINYGAKSISRANSLLGQTIRYIFTLELIGASILFMRHYWVHGYSLGKSAWYATFHAISAFCNAGITLYEQNLIPLREDLIYLTVITTLVILGGIGFLVLANVFHYRPWRLDLRNRGKISLHSRIVLWSSFYFLIGGGLLFTILEWNHSLNFQEIPSFWQSLFNGDWSTSTTALKLITQRVCAGISQAAIFRTAGFNFVEMELITPPSNLLSVFLMLVGGSPGSMAGGIKTTTIVVLILTIRAYLKGSPVVQLHKRTISDTICREAMVIIVYYLVMVFAFYFILLLTEQSVLAKRGDFVLFYEVASAFGTVGVSLNTTPDLSSVGKLLVALAMFIGRIGPISIAFMMARREMVHHIRYPEESITVG
jgi:trk system potassium uptake protein TrkH